MGNVAKVVNVIILIGAIIVGVYYYLKKPATLDEIYSTDHYWGSKPWKHGDPVPADDVSIKKFVLNIPDDVLIDLEERLNRTRLPTALKGVHFEYGMNSDTMKKIINYWTTNYDWRTNEKLINKYNHYKTMIEGINIHYIHVKPDKTKSKLIVPLILCHGWPGSFVEFLKIVPLLTTGDDLAFELIIPSLPGYGFSDASARPGLNAVHTARILSKLMSRLGHQHFFFHGGDWGAIVGKFMTLMYPNRLVGFHTTMPVTSLSIKDLIKISIGEHFPRLIYDNSDKEASMIHPFKDKLIFLLKETGYMHLQSTKPDTIGAVLNDSPAGLASYILEKFSTWTNPNLVYEKDGGLFDKVKYSMDEMLTNVMIYWVTGSITSSQRYYKESATFFMTDIHR